jgi:hypothetical protein
MLYLYFRNIEPHYIDTVSMIQYLTPTQMLFFLISLMNTNTYAQ